MSEAAAEAAVSRYRAIFASTTVFYGAVLGTMMEPLSDLQSIGVIKGFILGANFLSLGLLVFLIESLGEQFARQAGRRMAALLFVMIVITIGATAFSFAKITKTVPVLWVILFSAWLLTTLLIAFAIRLQAKYAKPPPAA